MNEKTESEMKVWIVCNGCAYIVGVYDSEAAARAARTQAEFDGVVGAYIETVTMNETRTVGVEE